jgi:hypothetical protein
MYNKINQNTELNVIERYNVALDIYHEFQIRLKYPVYGSLVFLTSDTKLFIAGGYNNQKGSIYNAYTIDLSNGIVTDLKALSTPAWTVYQPYLENNNILMFSTGEETEGYPQIISYTIDLPY